MASRPRNNFTAVPPCSRRWRAASGVTGPTSSSWSARSNKKRKPKDAEQWKERRADEVANFTKIVGYNPQNERELDVFKKAATAEKTMEKIETDRMERHARTHLPAHPKCEACQKAKIHHAPARRKTGNAKVMFPVIVTFAIGYAVQKGAKLAWEKATGDEGETARGART